MNNMEPKGAGPSPETIAFGRRVTAIRERFGWTKVHAAEKLGITGSALSRIESGQAGEISLDRALRIALAWGVDPHGLDARLAPAPTASDGPPRGEDGDGVVALDLYMARGKGIQLEPASENDRALLAAAGIAPSSLLPADPRRLLAVASRGARAILIRIPGAEPRMSTMEDAD